MIFRIPKNLYLSLSDASIFSAIGEFAFKVAKIKKGYYVYNRDAIQIGQIFFLPYEARITVADCGTISLTRDKKTCVYDVAPMPLAKEDERLKEFQNKIDGEYTLIGSFEEMLFDVYYDSKCVLNVLPDPQDEDFFKIRVNEGGNLVVLVLLTVAINKLNSDPKSEL